jgi:hypothetical protein
MGMHEIIRGFLTVSSEFLQIEAIPNFTLASHKVVDAIDFASRDGINAC